MPERQVLSRNGRFYAVPVGFMPFRQVFRRSGGKKQAEKQAVFGRSGRFLAGTASFLPFRQVFCRSGRKSKLKNKF